MRVMFRAQFRQPKNMGFAFPDSAVFHVEVYRKAEKWLAREPVRKNDYKFGFAVSHGSMKDQVAAEFGVQATAWLPFDKDGNQLDPDSYTEDPNGNFEAVELFHISAFGADGTQEKANHFRTACGLVVFVKQIRNVRGLNPPTCKECRKEWEKVKPEDRLR